MMITMIMIIIISTMIMASHKGQGHHNIMMITTNRPMKNMIANMHPLKITGQDLDKQDLLWVEVAHHHNRDKPQLLMPTLHRNNIYPQNQGRIMIDHEDQHQQQMSRNGQNLLPYHVNVAN